MQAPEEGPSGVQERTIADFGRQWLAFPVVDGYFASTALLADVLGPLVDIREIQGRRVAEVGSGQGRIVRMLLECGASHVLALEPSEAYTVLSANLRDAGSRVTLRRSTGEDLPGDATLDFVFSIGVIHHIPQPGPVVRAAYRALRPGGRVVIWVYGREGNEALLTFLLPVRRVTQRLPHRVLEGLVRLLDVPVVAYAALCRRFDLPLGGYFRGVLGRFGPRERRLTLYDQLNPAYAKYYRREEVRELLESAGFTDIGLHHRHGYSWTAVGTKPEVQRAGAPTASFLE